MDFIVEPKIEKTPRWGGGSNYTCWIDDCNQCSCLYNMVCNTSGIGEASITTPVEISKK